MSLRIVASVFPRQSPRRLIFASICDAAAADSTLIAVFMLTSSVCSYFRRKQPATQLMSRYNLCMTLTLDAATEKRIQREIDLGRYADVSEVVAHAVALLDAQQPSTAPAGHDATNSPIDEVFGIWADRHIDGVAYQETIRAEW
jgi:hypothetical protein